MINTEKQSKHNNLGKQIALLLIHVTAVLFSVILLFWLTSYLIEKFTHISPYTWILHAQVLEPVVLFATSVVLILLTGRIILSIVLLSVTYILFMLINAEMVKNLGLIFSPIDIKYSLQLFFAKEFLLSYWKGLLLSFFAIAGLLVFIYKTKPNPVISRFRGVAVFIILPLAFLLLAYNRYAIVEMIDNHYQFKSDPIPQLFAENNGFLFNFYYRILKNKPVKAPDNYAEQSIKLFYDQYSSPIGSPQNAKQPHVIIFFIEAFADPLQTEIETSQEAIPNFRKYASQGLTGLAISPEFGGRSANPEFELLTGLSMRNVPNKAIPYIDYFDRPYPSLAREFKSNGYMTRVIHVATLAFFNYRKAYELLGFDHISTLHGRDDVEIDPAGRFPSENALADEIIKVVSTSEEPQFIFSFPNSTHGLWGYDAYLDSELNVLGDFFGNGEKHLKTYINAIHQADKAIGKLVNHFKRTGEPVVLLVAGDHQPSLPEFRQKSALRWLKEHHPQDDFSTRRKLESAILSKALKTDYDFFKSNHQVPFMIWSNVESHANVVHTSMNFLPVLLLDYLKLNKSPFYQFLSKLQQNVKEYSMRTPVPEVHKSQIKTYQMIQYDIMSGENHYMNYLLKSEQ